MLEVTVKNTALVAYSVEEGLFSSSVTLHIFYESGENFGIPHYFAVRAELAAGANVSNLIDYLDEALEIKDESMQESLENRVREFYTEAPYAMAMLAYGEISDIRVERHRENIFHITLLPDTSETASRAYSTAYPPPIIRLVAREGSNFSFQKTKEQ